MNSINNNCYLPCRQLGRNAVLNFSAFDSYLPCRQLGSLSDTEEFDNLSYKELQEILFEIDKRLKEFDKPIGLCSDGGRGSYKQ